MEQFMKKKSKDVYILESKKPPSKEPPKLKINQDEIRKYKEFKQKMITLAKQEQKKKEFER